MARIPAPPTDYAQTVTLTRAFNLQYPGDALTVTASAAGATGYEVRRTEAAGGHTLIDSGAFTSGMSLGTAGSGTYAKYGHYTLKLTGPDRVDGQYTTDYGTCRFVIAENVATMPLSPTTPGTAAGGYSYGLHSPLAHGVFSLGNFRSTNTAYAAPTTAAISQAISNISTYWTYWGQYADGVRPRQMTLQTLANNTATDVQDNASRISEIVAGTWGQVHAGFLAGYTGRNEPSPTVFNLAEAQALGTAVRNGNAAAKAFGPDLVSLGLQTSPGGAPGLFNLIDAGILGPGALDGISYHEYNMSRDLTGQALPIYRNLKAGLVARGVDLTKVWNTEGGNETTWQTSAAPNGQGNLLMRQAGSAYITGTLVREIILGLPYERAFTYYDLRAGYDQVAQWQLSNSGPYAGWALHRAFAREVTQMNVVGEYDLGDAKDLYLAGHWQNPSTGAGVAAFIANGPGLPGLVCDVSGAATLTVVDCWGNTTSTPVVGGTVTVTPSDFPTYVRIPSGVTFTPRAQTWGANLLPAAGVTYTDSGETQALANRQKLTDGVRATSYAYSSGSAAAAGSGYRTTSATFPRTLDVTMSSGSITANKVIVVCPMPWQSQPALMDFDVQVQVGGSWVTKATYTQTTQTVKNFDYQSDSRVDAYTEAQRTFIVDLGGTLTITGVRLNIRAGSFGMYLDPTMALNPGTTNPDPNVATAAQVQSIEAYNATASAPTSNPYVVRNIT